MEDTILKRIRSHDIRVRPRLYFTLQLVALAVVACITLLLSVALFNFIFFTVRISGNGTLLDFGPRGFWAYLIFFPWPLLALDIACVLMLQFLLRKFRFGYHIPVLYLLLVLFAISVVPDSCLIAVRRLTIT